MSASLNEWYMKDDNTVALAGFLVHCLDYDAKALLGYLEKPYKWTPEWGHYLLHKEHDEKVWEARRVDPKITHADCVKATWENEYADGCPTCNPPVVEEDE